MKEPTNLKALEPTEAQRLYLESRIGEWADATMKVEQFRVNNFTEWLVSEQIADMRDVSGRTVHRYRLSIKGDIEDTTVWARIASVKRFLWFCVSIDGIDPNIPERIETPTTKSGVKTETLEAEHAKAALTYLNKYAYASREHALLALCWDTGFRTGTLRSLDVEDVDIEKNRLRVRHRPETGTPLKNGERAERFVAISPELTDVLKDYIDTRRSSVSTSSGDGDNRNPLFTTSSGRPSVATIRRAFESVTRPCLYGECPVGKDPSEREAAGSSTKAKDCPESVGGHAIRRGAITRFLRDEIPRRAIEDRCNVSGSTLDRHYDVRTESEKAESRRQYFS